jgi:uncharacterized protein YndB with AHSA1/START domain
MMSIPRLDGQPAGDKVEAMDEGTSIPVQVTRSFHALPERVFDAWLDPAWIAVWMFGPRVRDEELVKLELDARVGGTFSFVVRRGEQTIDHVGRYVEIERPRRLVFTWAVAPEPIDSSRVLVELTQLEAGSELTLTHELAPEWSDFADRTREAWSKMLDALATAVEPE